MTQQRLPLFPTGLPPAAVDVTGPLGRNQKCRRCTLGQSATKVCLPPAGEPGGLLLVSSSPTGLSDHIGQPFVDDKHRYVVGVVKKYWSGPVAMTYGVQCGSDGPPSDTELGKCRPYLRSYLDATRPRRIIAMGETACKALLGRSVNTQSARAGFTWVRIGSDFVPVIYTMAIHNLDGRFAWAEFERNVATACQTPLDFFKKRRADLEGASYSIVNTAEEARLAANDLRTRAITTNTPIGWDVESKGKQHNKDFRIISAALGLTSDFHSYVWTRKALNDPGARAALISLLQDEQLCWAEQGSYDELAALCDLKVGIAGERRDVQLLRKALDCAVYQADLDTMSELEGFGGYKAEFDTLLKKAELDMQKWNPKQPALFDDCPDPESRAALRALWDESKRLDDAKIYQTYKFSYLFALVPPDKLTIYNARDKIATGILHDRLWAQLRADSGLAFLWDNVTGPASRSYTMAEFWGAPMDRATIQAVIDASEASKRLLEPQLRAHLPPKYKNILLSSPEQLAELFYSPKETGGFGFPVVRRTKGNAPSIDEEALEDLEAATAHPFIRLYRGYVAQDTDRKKAEEFARFLREDGRLHPSYLLDGTKTGRPSCTSPNLFNMKSPEEHDACSGKGCADCGHTGTDEESRRIRACFTDPSDDFVIFEADESQVELRGMAVLSEEDVLIDAYLHRRDIHQETVEFVFQRAGKQIVRRTAKVGNFMIPYGGKAGTFAASLKLPLDVAKEIFAAIEGRYPKVLRKKSEMLAEARRTGYTYNVWFPGDGSYVVCQKRPLWDLDSADHFRRSKAENAVFNTAIQGTFSGSIILASHARIVQWIMRNHLDHLWRPSVNVYDSIIGPVHKALLPLAARITVDVMTSWVVAKLSSGQPFPLEADCKVGRNLGVAKKYKPPKTYREAIDECRSLGLEKHLRRDVCSGLQDAPRNP